MAPCQAQSKKKMIRCRHYINGQNIYSGFTPCSYRETAWLRACVRLGTHGDMNACIILACVRINVAQGSGQIGF